MKQKQNESFGKKESCLDEIYLGSKKNRTS